MVSIEANIKKEPYTRHSCQKGVIRFPLGTWLRYSPRMLCQLRDESYGVILMKLEALIVDRLAYLKPDSQQRRLSSGPSGYQNSSAVIRDDETETDSNDGNNTAYPDNDSPDNINNYFYLDISHSIVLLRYAETMVLHNSPERSKANADGQKSANALHKEDYSHHDCPGVGGGKLFSYYDRYWVL
ncbi:hypothetical protein VP1G_11019 [Cytospora mali]|uniref:Uncharacterized protein n=1 Tax=Cytospora mali TaxID=578113 RepID=A0A194V3D4_CYTMA|nr:hypothetical protein VP1G_11019 [Valsa mali var. pyri (nom. inval.)]